MSSSALDFDVVIVGSGPAGVSAAFPLVEAGLRVLMVDAGVHAPPSIPINRASLAESRLAALNQKGFSPYNKNYQAFNFEHDISPRTRLSAALVDNAAYMAANAIDAVNFKVVGTCLTGGLGNIWGAAVSVFDHLDLDAWPINSTDIAASYLSIAKRIGISGSIDDALSEFHGTSIPIMPPLPLALTAKVLLKHFEQTKPDPKFVMGHARSAVISMPANGRKECILCNACFWGCQSRAIYNSYDDVIELKKSPNFSLLTCTVVENITVGPGWLDVQGRHNKTSISIRAPTVILAAGVLGTTRLALSAGKREKCRIAVLNTPCASMALYMPKFFGQPLPLKGFNLAQLSVRIALSDSKDYALLQLYSATGMAAPDLFAHMPFSLRGNQHLMRALQPGLLLGLLYLPSEYSNNYADFDHGRLTVVGEKSCPSQRAMQQLKWEITVRLAKMGAYFLPGSFQLLTPGAEVHVGGTLPLGKETTVDGMLVNTPGLYIADSSVFNRLPAKHHTLTMMANADRIATNLARRLVGKKWSSKTV